MRALASAPSVHHGTRPSYVPPSLQEAKAVYVRHDARRQPLQRPYDGPYTVLQRSEKFFTIDRSGAPYTVSRDRLKAAVFPGQEADDNTPPTPTTPPARDPTPEPPRTPPWRAPSPSQPRPDNSLEEFPPLPPPTSRRARPIKPRVRLDL